MSTNKTTPSKMSVEGLLQDITGEKRKTDCQTLIHLIKSQTGLEPSVWGTSIIGFGNYHYVYDSGHKGEAPIVGLASRANAIVLYLSTEFEKKDELLQHLGKYKTGKGCLYIRTLEDIQMEVLRTMINNSVEYIKNRYPDKTMSQTHP